MGAKKYFIDENRLMNINDDISAYILGFIWADGNIINNKIMIHIKTDDFQNLYKILNKIGNWGIIHRKKYLKKTNKHYKSTTIYYSSKKLYTFLCNHDYKIKSKTQPIKILSKIPIKYHNHFYRGYVDGDGSFSFYNNNKTCKFNITSYIKQNWTFIEKLFDNIGINKYSIYKYDRKSGKSSLICIDNKWDIITIGDYLYENCKNNKYERKYIIFNNIKNSKIKKSTNKWTKKDENFLLENYDNKKLCCEKLNRTSSSIYGKYHILMKNLK